MGGESLIPIKNVFAMLDSDTVVTNCVECDKIKEDDKMRVVGLEKKQFVQV